MGSDLTSQGLDLFDMKRSETRGREGGVVSSGSLDKKHALSGRGGEYSFGGRLSSLMISKDNDVADGTQRELFSMPRMKWKIVRSGDRHGMYLQRGGKWIKRDAQNHCKKGGPLNRGN